MKTHSILKFGLSLLFLAGMLPQVLSSLQTGLADAVTALTKALDAVDDSMLLANTQCGECKGKCVQKTLKKIRKKAVNLLDGMNSVVTEADDTCPAPTTFRYGSLYRSQAKHECGEVQLGGDIYAGPVFLVEVDESGLFMLDSNGIVLASTPVFDYLQFYYNPVTQRIFVSTSPITSYNLSLSDVQTLSSTGNIGIIGLGGDSSRNELFIAGRVIPNSFIWKVGMDGNNLEVIADIEKPFAFAVDPNNRS